MRVSVRAKIRRRSKNKKGRERDGRWSARIGRKRGLKERRKGR
jgi:hypothetical protein